MVVGYHAAGSRDAFGLVVLLERSKGSGATTAAIADSWLLVFNAQPTGTVISRRYTDIKVNSPCGIKGRY